MSSPLRVTIVLLGVWLIASPVFSQYAVRPDTQAPTPADKSLTYSVVYTGRLFGYFRVPAVQDEVMRDCSKAPGSASDPALEFKKEVKRFPSSNLEVRLAVGDNFAPVLQAREMKLNGTFIAKDLLAFDTTSAKHEWLKITRVPDSLVPLLVEGRSTIPFDNVACFLRQAHFDAIVPGKHDFYYGPERVRQLAAVLATPKDADFEPVQMLAANLSIATRDNARTPLPRSLVKHDGYETNSANVGGARPVLPKVVLPWLRRIKIAGAIQVVSGTQTTDLEDLLRDATFAASDLNRVDSLTSGTITIEDQSHNTYSVTASFGAAALCPADSSNPSLISLPKKDSPDTCVRLKPVRLEPGKTSGPLTIDRFYYIEDPQVPDSMTRAEFAIPPNTNQAVCLFVNADVTQTGKVYCQPFSVHVPFLEYPAPIAPAPPDCTPPPPGRIVPFALKKGAGGCVAIFGVVDPSLREYVGALNDTWLNKKREGSVGFDLNEERETHVEVSDPVEALTQLVQYCDAHDACVKARKILLAQMPRARAAQIAARFRTGTFDLVIAQSDYDRASGTLDFTRTVSFKSAGGVDDISEPVVLVPGAHFSATEPDHVRVRLQQATVGIYPDVADGATSERRRIVNRAEPGEKVMIETPLPSTLPVTPGAKTLFGWISGSTFAPNLPPAASLPSRKSKRTSLESLALMVMRQHCRADVAILQHRDIFFSSEFDVRNLDKPALRLALDAVYWKGDFIICRSLTGSTIKQILTRSAELATAEANGVFTELEFERDLAQLGVLKDPESGEYVIDGQFLEDKKLYSVATTDFIAEGDTGYSVLQTAAPRKAPIGEGTTLDRLSAGVYAALSGDTAVQDDTGLHAADYLDALMLAPADTTELGRWQAAAVWWKRLFLINDAVKGASALEQSAQQHPFWSLSLENASVKFSEFNHTGSETEVNNNFGGSGVSEVKAPEERSLGIDLQLRLKRSGHRRDWYGLGELQRERKEQHKPDDSGTIESVPANQLALEGGVLVNLHRSGRNPFPYKLLLAMRLETQVTTPFRNIKVGETSMPADLPRDFYLTGKLGARHEFRDSALEGGVLIGEKFNSVTEFVFIRSGSAPLRCKVTIEQSLDNCVKGADPKLAAFDRAASAVETAASTIDHMQRGWFLNVRLHFPVPFLGLKFLSEEKGQYFFKDEKRDIAVDTRYRVSWKNALEVPVIGNFSLAPSVEWFFFENKVTPHVYRSRKYAVDFKYSFERRSGMRWKDALAYPSPAPTK